MFCGCEGLTSLDVSGFDVSKVTEMSSMFLACISLQTIYCNDSWSCKSSMSMFNQCIQLSGAVKYDSTKTDVTMANPTTGYFTSRKVYAIWCEGNQTLYFDVSAADIQVGSNYEGQTVTCVDVSKYSNIPQINSVSKSQVKTVRFMPAFKSFKPTRLNYKFGNWSSLEQIIDLKYLNTSKVTSMDHMFASCKNLTGLDLSNFDTSNVKELSYMFYGCESLTTLDLSNFDTSNVKELSYMFYGCESLTTLDLSNFDTSNVEYLGDMFYRCKNLTTLDLSSFDTSKVTRMDHVFAYCTSLTSLDLSNFVTSKVTTMSGMFDSCSSMTTLNLMGFDTSSVTDMDRMFAYCTSLRTIYCNDSWNCNSSYNMFYGCTNLVGLVPYNSSYVKVSMANPTTGYFTAIHAYDLWLGGMQVTSVNNDEIPVSSGKACYDPSTKTLTLNGVYLENGSDNYCIKSEINGLTIALEGVNTLKSTKAGIGLVNSALKERYHVSIKGPGQLKIEASEYGIAYAYCTLVISYCSGVTITGNITGSMSLLFHALNPDKVPEEDYERLIIFNTNVTVQGVIALTNLLLDETTVEMTEPSGGYFKFPTVYDASGNISEKTVIQIKKSVIRGDVNEDGTVDINDVVAIINRMAGTATWPNADVNGDDTVDINDVVAVINIMAGK